MTTVTEIAPEIFRICTYLPELGMQFNQFVVRDQESLLYHTGMKGMFPVVRDAIAKVIDPARLQWIAFSHFEADECGALNEFLAIAPEAQALCSLVGAMVSVNDFASRAARGLHRMVRLSRPVLSGFDLSARRICRIRGKRGICLRNLRGRCFVLICFIRMASWSR